MNVREIRDKYNNIKLTEDHLIVALFGYRTLGFVSNKESHKEERWTRNPWVFDNNYYQELLDSNSPYVKTPSDKALLQDDGFRKWVEKYSKDEKLFFDNFSEAYVRISELGCTNLLAEK
jgi:catalase (peroxidase I)